MVRKVAIIGIGQSQTNSIISDLSYKELMFQAAVKAYHDAEIESKDVKSFILSHNVLFFGDKNEKTKTVKEKKKSVVEKGKLSCQIADVTGVSKIWQEDLVC